MRHVVASSVLLYVVNVTLPIQPLHSDDNSGGPHNR